MSSTQYQCTAVDKGPAGVQRVSPQPGCFGGYFAVFRDKQASRSRFERFDGAEGDHEREGKESPQLGQRARGVGSVIGLGALERGSGQQTGNNGRTLSVQGSGLLSRSRAVVKREEKRKKMVQCCNEQVMWER